MSCHWPRPSFVLLRRVLVCFSALLLLHWNAHAQFFSYIRAIPERDATGAALPGANTAFADGAVFQPVGDESRSSSWAWRPYGDSFILSSLGPSTSTPPTGTKELVTTVSGLQPGTKYAVKALFWSPDTALWGVRAGLSYCAGVRTNKWFDNSVPGVIPANLVPWETLPGLFSQSGRDLYAAPVGSVTANSNGVIKIFIHDLPSGDSNRRTWYQGVAIGTANEDSCNVVALDGAGTPFHRGVRGLALADVAITRGEYWVGIPRSLEVARGSAIRGVATGLAADLYDWRTRNGQPRPPTLQFLRYSRDFNAELYLGANIRGIVEPNPGGGVRYFDTSTNTLAILASEWVRYVNHIVPTYRQGDTITDPRDLAILNSLTWSSEVAGDSFDKLLAPGEPAVPKIVYWEIGNEPTIGVTSFSVSNSYTLDATNFYSRYSAVAKAIKAEDPTVKVGPTLVNGSRESAHLAAIAADPSLPIDFVTYHPYEKMGTLTNAHDITLHLGSIYSRQSIFLRDIRRVLADNGRNPDAIEYAATEVNVSNWDTNDSDKEARMAHALGTVETVFTHARLGLVASHYWIWPTHRWDGTEYPVFKAYEKLRDHMGDTLVSTYAAGDIRVYTTRDSRTGAIAVWGLNFSETNDTTIDLELLNGPALKRATLLRLQDKSGRTSLFSLNSSTEMPGGRVMNVDWTGVDVTGQNLRLLQLPAATLTLLALEPGLAHVEPMLTVQGSGNCLAVKFRRLPFASRSRYILQGSDDLQTWTPVREVQPTGTNDWITIADDHLLETCPRRFLRVRVVNE